MTAGRPKGYPKSGGRAKGVTNKKTSKFNDELKDKGFNLVDRIVALANKTEDEQILLKLIELTAKYSISIPKQIEVPTESSDTNDESFDEASIVSLIVDDK